MIRPLAMDTGTTPPQTCWKVWRPGGDTLLFLLLVYLYVWLVVDPRLIRQSIGVLTYYHFYSFHTDWAFLRDHAARPGGPLEYATRLISQGYAWGWLGALLVTAAAWQGSRAVDLLGRLAGRPRGAVFRYVPAVLLVVMCGKYSLPLGAVLSLQAGLLAFAWYVRWAPTNAWRRLASLGFAGAILYYLAGSGSCLFPVLVAVYELLVARRAALAAAAVVASLIVPCVWAVPLGVELREAYGGFLADDPGVLPGNWPLTLALYVFFPAVLSAGALARAISARRPREVPGPSGQAHPTRRTERRASNTARGKTDRPRRSRRLVGEDSGEVEGPAATSRPAPRASRWRSAVLPAALVLAGGALAAWSSLDTLTRTVLELDYHAEGGRWPEALAAADRLPDGFYNVRCHRNVMLALHHAERLGDDMFRYPQRPGVDLFSTPGEARDLGSWYQESRLFLELGHINQAEKSACEALETCGDMPAVLEELALINIVKGRPETAMIFCRALALHPLQRRAARELLARLADDPQLAGDLRVAQLRRNMVDKDYVALDTSVEEFLQALLEKNPHNRLAFELLLAHYLAVGRPDAVVAWLGRLPNFSSPRVPRLYQEAAVIHARSSGRPPVIPGHALDAAVLARADEFARLAAGARSREQAIEAALAAGFGDSYFFYWAFGVSGR